MTVSFVLEVKDDTTRTVAAFYSDAPFPNYQGYENRFMLEKVVSENAILNDLKKTHRIGKEIH